MAATHQVWLRDQAGVRIALFTDWIALSFWQAVNDVGGYTLTLRDDPAYAEIIDLFLDGNAQPIKDLMLEFWREDASSDPLRPLAWYLEAAYFTRRGWRHVRDDGEQVFSSEGVDYTDLLRRSSIAWYAGSAETAKSGAAETVLKEYADENLGPGALAGAGRDRDHVYPGLTIAADLAGGNVWDGQRSHRNVLEIMQEVALPGNVRFRIEPGAAPATFVFDARQDQWGQDRTTVGLDPATGRNGAGNTPVIFSLERGNLRIPEYELDARTEVSVAIVQGQGEGVNRTVAIRTSGTETDSPWNDIEVSRDARDTDLLADLQARGDEVLDQNRAVETFRIGVLQVPSTIYGLDYRLGDRVTAEYKGRELHVEIMRVPIAVQHFQDLPGPVEDIELEVELLP